MFRNTQEMSASPAREGEGLASGAQPAADPVQNSPAAWHNAFPPRPDKAGEIEGDAREEDTEEEEEDEDEGDIFTQLVSMFSTPAPPESAPPEEEKSSPPDSPKPNPASSPIMFSMNDLVENFMATTEQAVSTVAEVIREGVNDTADTLHKGITQTEFYRMNVKYEPEDALPAPDLTEEESVPNLMITTRTLEERIRQAGQSIGYLKVKVMDSLALSVDGTYLPDHTHPYLKISLGPFQHWTSPVAKEAPHMLGSFTFDHDLDFVAQDVNADLAIEVWEKNVLSADQLIGQVLVPLPNILPKVKNVINGAHPRHAPYVLEGWFELFPLQVGKRKFTPAAGDISETGMPRKVLPLGFLRLSLELHLHGRISMWAGYALPRLEPVLGPSQPPMPSGDLKAISAINESGRRFKRNFQRVKKGFARLLSRGEAAWVPARFIKLARSWKDPKVSILAWFLVCYGCLYSPPYLLPLNLYIVLLVSTLSLHGKHEREKSYLMWNEDIHDPDDELGPIQKVAKVIYLLEKFERWMGIAADNLERATNVFSFADERVTIAALLVFAILSIALSLALFIVTPGYLFFCVFAVLLAPPWTKSLTRYLPVLTTAVPSNVIPDEDSVSLRQGGSWEQARAVVRLALRAPALVRNIFQRVPTDDELGHRWIAKRQLVKGEPKVKSVLLEGLRKDVDLDVSLLREM